MLQLEEEKREREWSDAELEAAIVAYTSFVIAIENGEKLNRADVYRALAEKFGRTPKAFEFRMQNISSVLDSMGLGWLAGFKPKRNVGANVRERIAEIIRRNNQFRGPLEEPCADDLALERRSEELLRRGLLNRPIGNPTPRKSSVSRFQYFRSPIVKAWLVQNANGRCEVCDQQAPFNKSDGSPYLEVHHLMQIAHGGPDTVENAVALCPNCHRQLHYGENVRAVLETLYGQIGRLVR